MQKYHLSPEEIDAFLDRKKEGVLTTIGQDGFPYGTPVNYVRIGDKIYFHGRHVGEKVSNLESCNKICLTVMESAGFEHCGPCCNNTTTNYESVIVRGTVSKVTDEAEKVKILEATIAKLVPERVKDEMNPAAAKAAAVYEITVVSATGKYHRPMPDHKVMY